MMTMEMLQRTERGGKLFMPPTLATANKASIEDVV